jgi:transcriptional regulator with GAF, ATPase, and Fis domain
MARRFLETTSRRLNLPPRTLSSEYERTLVEYDFPGNVRELQNIIERALVLRREDSRGPQLQFDSPLEAAPPSTKPTSPASNGEAVLTVAELYELEHRNFVKALELSKFQIAGPGGAARRLGLSPSTLSYRLKQMGIERPK